MVRDILTYPQKPSVEFNAPVRKFDEQLFQLLEDLKDTLEHHNLRALSAYQIGSPYSVILYKDKDGQYIELINARIFTKKGKITTEESTFYFQNLTAKVTRDQYIKIMYEDRNQNQKFLDLEDEEAILLQRKIDYNFGSSFLIRLDKDEKRKFEQKLEFGSNIAIAESCPIFSYKDQINKILKFIFVAMFILLVSLLFVDDTIQKDLFEYQKYLSLGLFIGTIIYFFTGYIEGKRYSSCTSCQIGNLIGTVVIHWAKLAGVLLIHYFIVF